jgi:ABC-type transporter Mla subunit MlaD
MRRALAIASVLLAAGALAVFSTGAGDGGGYKVRAIFNNAAFVIKGEDVKVAGVKVGQIESLDVTEDKKAAVVLDITDAGYHNFRKDATCTIRPQGLIGEKFIECRPTIPHGLGAPKSPLLPKIEKGPGKGQYLLPASNTSRPIDLDLINNIARLPYRQRLTIILNEFGTGLAGNGENLNQAIRAANPAFKELENVVALLASENKVLARLAVDGDTVLKPLARERLRFAGFIKNAGITAEATAERSAALNEDFAKFPAFLREFGPTMDAFNRFNESLIPISNDLTRGATSINEFVTGAPAFTDASTKAIVSLGDTADVAGPALTKSQPTLNALGTLASKAGPLSTNLASLLTSFQDQSGLTNLLDFAYYVSGATNGVNEFGHYLRAQLVLNTCATYTVTNDPACTANFNKDFGAVTAPAGTGKVASAQTAAAPTLTTADAAPSLTRQLRAATGHRNAPARVRQTDAATTRSLLDYLLGQ